MKIHWLQHVPFEGLGLIEKWALEHGHTLSCTRLYEGETFPDQDDFQLLIVMGGPMGVDDTETHGWLLPEKEFLAQSVQSKKPILGICLGAQLLASVLGAQVLPNKEKEIGWFPVVRDDDIPEKLAAVLPGTPTVFHWHGDTFSLPTDASRLYASSGCANQAFLYGDRVIGLQFHIETTAESVGLLVSHCANELVPGKWIQKRSELLQTEPEQFKNYTTLTGVLEYLLSAK